MIAFHFIINIFITWCFYVIYKICVWVVSIKSYSHDCRSCFYGKFRTWFQWLTVFPYHSEGQMVRYFCRCSVWFGRFLDWGSDAVGSNSRRLRAIFLGCEHTHLWEYWFIVKNKNYKPRSYNHTWMVKIIYLTFNLIHSNMI